MEPAQHHFLILAQVFRRRWHSEVVLGLPGKKGEAKKNYFSAMDNRSRIISSIDFLDAGEVGWEGGRGWVSAVSFLSGGLAPALFLPSERGMAPASLPPSGNTLFISKRPCLSSLTTAPCCSFIVSFTTSSHLSDFSMSE